MIFPDWAEQTAPDGSEALPLYTEWAVDWNAKAFALRDGAPYTVTGDKALQVWVRCALHPESVRFLFSAHSPDYGNQITALLADTTDQGILESLLRRELRETLLVSPYIRAVDGFAFERHGSRLTVRFSVHTIYEGFTAETEVVTT